MAARNDPSSSQSPCHSGGSRQPSSLFSLSSTSSDSEAVRCPVQVGKGVGRPRTSAVWDYMDCTEFDDGTAETTCKILVHDPYCESGHHVCDHIPFPHKNTSSLKEHLKRKHPREYQIVNEKDTKKNASGTKRATKGKSSKNVETAAPSVVPYSKDDPQYMFITHHLAFFIG